MKARFFLMVSLLLNCVLLGTVLFTSKPRPVTIPEREVRTNPVGVASSRQKPVMGGGAEYRTPWEALKARDYRRMIELLEAAGCPRETIEDLVMMTVGAEYQERLLRMEEEYYRGLEFWKEGRSQADWFKHNLERRRMKASMERAIEELTGVNYAELAGKVLGWQRSDPLSWLPKEKRWALKEAQLRFEEEELEAKTRGMLFTPYVDEDQKEEVARVRKRQRGELERLLTAEELREYDARNSPAAEFVKRKMPAAKSEEEFRAMVEEAAKALGDTRVGALDLVEDYEERKQREEQLAKRVTERLKEVIGEERVAEQTREKEEQNALKEAREKERQEEQARARFREIGKEVGVPEGTAEAFLEELKELKVELEAKYPRVEKLSEEEQKALEAVIEAEFLKKAQELMGEKGAEFVEKVKKM